MENYELNYSLNYNKAEFLTSFGISSQLPKSELPEIVFSGRSNVGKSSLINKIFNRKSLARVSSSPGKTVTINFYKVEEVLFVDLPGYGYAKTSKSEKRRWEGLVEGYFNGNRNIGLVIQLVDSRHPPSKDDLQMIEYLKQAGIPFIVVMTKIDKLSVKEKRQRLDSIKAEIPGSEGISIIPFSSANGEGLEDLKFAVHKALVSI